MRWSAQILDVMTRNPADYGSMSNVITGISVNALRRASFVAQTIELGGGVVSPEAHAASCEVA